MFGCITFGQPIGVNTIHRLRFADGVRPIPCLSRSRRQRRDCSEHLTRAWKSTFKGQIVTYSQMPNTLSYNYYVYLNGDNNE